MIVTVSPPPTITLEEFLANPPEHQEWVNGELIEKTDMTIKHSKIQVKLAHFLVTYLENTNQQGYVYTELPCKTINQGRRPDVCYLTPELAVQYEDASSLPQSPPLIAEIASPNDSAEDLFAKATEYLASQCQEVWLVFPESKRVLIILPEKTLAFSHNDSVSTQTVLTGFKISVNDLFN